MAGSMTRPTTKWTNLKDFLKIQWMTPVHLQFGIDSQADTWLNSRDKLSLSNTLRIIVLFSIIIMIM